VQIDAQVEADIANIDGSVTGSAQRLNSGRRWAGSWCGWGRWRGGRRWLANGGRRLPASARSGLSENGPIWIGKAAGTNGYDQQRRQATDATHG
jgi:hypothetical protein